MKQRSIQRNMRKDSDERCVGSGPARDLTSVKFPGVGDTTIPMYTTLVTMWLVQIPLAWALPEMTELGVYGVRWAIVTAIVMRGVVYAIYFKRGRWRRLQV